MIIVTENTEEGMNASDLKTERRESDIVTLKLELSTKLQKLCERYGWIINGKPKEISALKELTSFDCERRIEYDFKHPGKDEDEKTPSRTPGIAGRSHPKGTATTDRP